MEQDLKKLKEWVNLHHNDALPTICGRIQKLEDGVRKINFKLEEQEEWIKSLQQKVNALETIDNQGDKEV